MSATAGHAIQRLIHNTPVDVSANSSTSTIVTSGGTIFMSGLIGNKIQATFEPIHDNTDIVGKVVDSQSTDDSVYFLNSAGSVFQYDYNKGNNHCNPVIREVYSPTVCCGDKAKKIATGRAHAVILTEKNKVYGVGDNESYQIVPQGQCDYDVSVEMVVTDTNLHDNNCCVAFTGIYNELTTPVIPSSTGGCSSVSCIQNSVTGVLVGSVSITNVSITPLNRSTIGPGTLNIPVYADYSYVGFLCVDCNGNATGSVTITITNIYVKAGCQTATLFTGEDPTAFGIAVQNPVPLITSPVTQTVAISGQCGSSVTLPLTLNLLPLNVTQSGSNNHFTLSNNTTPDSNIVVTNATVAINSGGTSAVTSSVSFSVPLDCCSTGGCEGEAICCKPSPKLPQPCWMDIFAGADISVLVDSCNRLYVFGSLWKARSNHGLLQRSCLEKLLDGTVATITLPADQLNCGSKPRNGTCECVKCRDKCFETDLSRFGIQLNFANGYMVSDCATQGIDGSMPGACTNNTSLCDFLKALKQCNEAPQCNSTCRPCDSYIYLDVDNSATSACGVTGSSIGSLTLYNRKSVCKAASTGVSDIYNYSGSSATVVEFDLNHYCLDGTDVCLDKVIVISLGQGPNVNLYLDITQPGGIMLSAKCHKTNVEFTIDANTSTHQYLLNYGDAMDPVELANLRAVFSLSSIFPCPRFLNPFTNKVTNSYLIGGDSIKFLSVSNELVSPRVSVTADVPTVFRLTRRVLDIGVGWNNLSVLVGGLACPNEIFVIGENCSGELGIQSNESVVCWKQVNRCLFDCQVNSIFSGKGITFYITQSGRVYGAGSWKCLVCSTIPACIPSICQNWHIKEIGVSQNQVILLGGDGSVFGVGDNSLGELGLCHTECVRKPSPLSFSRIDRCVAKQLCEGLRHPVERHERHERHERSERNCSPCKKKECKCPKPCNCSDKRDESCICDSCQCGRPCKESCEREHSRERDEVRYIRYPHRHNVKKYIPNTRSCYVPVNRFRRD